MVYVTGERQKEKDRNGLCDGRKTEMVYVTGERQKERDRNGLCDGRKTEGERQKWFM